MKTASQSKTVWAFGVQTVGALVLLVMHYTGAAPTDPEVLAAAWTGVLSGIMGIALRFRTTVPLSRGDDDEPGRGGPLFLVLLCVLFVSACCGSVTGKRWSITIKRGPPCVVSATMDGDLILEGTATEPCEVEVQ